MMCYACMVADIHQWHDFLVAEAESPLKGFCELGDGGDAWCRDVAPSAVLVGGDAPRARMWPDILVLLPLDVRWSGSHCGCVELVQMHGIQLWLRWQRETRGKKERKRDRETGWGIRWGYYMTPTSENWHCWNVVFPSGWIKCLFISLPILNHELVSTQGHGWVFC